MALARRFNPPPGWPPLPHPSWTPPPGFRPGPGWPPPPDGWNFWINVEVPGVADQAKAKWVALTLPQRWIIGGAAATVALFLAVVFGYTVYDRTIRSPYDQGYAYGANLTLDEAGDACSAEALSRFGGGAAANFEYSEFFKGCADRVSGDGHRDDD